MNDKRPKPKQSLNLEEVFNSLETAQKEENEKKIISQKKHPVPSKKAKNASLLKEGKLFQSINTLPQMAFEDTFTIVEQHLKTSLALQAKKVPKNLNRNK